MTDHEPYPTLRELRAKIRKYGVTPTRDTFGLFVGDDKIWTTLIDRRCCGLGIALIGRSTEQEDDECADLDCGVLWGEDWTWGYIHGFDDREKHSRAEPEYKAGYRLGKSHARALVNIA